MALPDSFLDELLARTDIVDLITRYVPLKKTGSRYTGLCPFHHEKTPSFSVSPDKQLFHCFGCGEGGGAVQFLMKIENLPFLDAVRKLADMNGMQLPENDGESEQQRQSRERLFAVNKEAARFFHAELFSPRGTRGLNYFLARGLSKKTMIDFGLGFAPDAWDALRDHLLSKGFRPPELELAGLAMRGQKGGLYDRFRNRVMFPIINIRGQVVGFGGRVLGDEKPKYLNSNDTPVFQKNRNLFAINLAKKTKQDRMILAEGYMDVIALHQAGFDCAVASLGTALTPGQAKLMRQFVKEAVICYDSDGAGQKAAQRAIDLLNGAGLEVRVLRLPDAKDPDEFIKKNGADAFAQLLDRPQTDTEYRLSGVRAKFDLTRDDERIAYLKESAVLIAGFSSEIEREIFARNVARETGISEAAMLNEVKRVMKSRARKETAALDRRAQNPVGELRRETRELKYENLRSALCEEKLLALVFGNADLLDRAEQKLTPQEFSSDFLAKIFEAALAQRRAGRELSPASCMTALDEAQIRQVSAAIAGAVRSQEPERELDDYIEVIREEHRKKTETGAERLRELAERRRQQKG